MYRDSRCLKNSTNVIHFFKFKPRYEKNVIRYSPIRFCGQKHVAFALDVCFVDVTLLHKFFNFKSAIQHTLYRFNRVQMRLNAHFG